MNHAAPVARSELRWTIGAVLVLLLLHLFAAACLPLSPDEAYYLSWSRFPAWSYYDHPPMIAWWIWAGTHLLGETPLGVRLFAVLSMVPTSLALYATGRTLANAPTAALAVLWINATLLVGVGGMSATPDAPSVMFWTLAILGLAALVATREGVWWLLIGAAIGLGVISKLTDLFILPGIVLALLAASGRRGLLKSAWPWAGLATAALICLPVVLWNAGHDWVTFGKQFSRVTTGGFQPLHLPEFFVTQFLLLNPLVASFVGLAINAWMRRDQRYPLDGIALLLWSALPVIAYMTLHSVHAQIPGNWLAPVYPSLALVAAQAAMAAPAEHSARGRVLAFPLGAVLSVVGLIAAANPAGLIPPALDLGRVLRGWDGLAQELETYRRQAHATWIGADYYGMVGELQWRLGASRIPVIGITEQDRYAYQPPPDPTLAAQPGLIIAADPLPRDTEACLQGLSRLGTIDRKSGPTTVQNYAVYSVETADPHVFTAGCGSAPAN